MKDYPSLSPYRKRSVFPEDVQRALLAFQEAVSKGRVAHHQVQAALDGLSNLPAEICPSGAREIPGLAFPYQLDYRPLLAKHHALAGIYLFHWDGYMREAALRMPSALRLTPFWVAAIVQRLNDWVPQVRRAAMDCLTSVLLKADVSVLIDVATSLLHRRRQWKRGEEELTVLDDLVSAPGVFDGLIEYLTVAYEKAPHRTLVAMLKYPELDRALPAL